METRPQVGLSLSQLLGLRVSTDYRISAGLVLSAVASWFLWAAWIIEAGFSPLSSLSGANPSFLLSLLIFVAIVANVPTGYLVYLLLNRRNEHFGRSEAILGIAVQRLKSTIASSDQNRMFAANSAERDLWGLSAEQKDRSGYLMSLLTLVPILGWLFLAYSLYRVDSDFRKHEHREFAVIEEVQRAFGLPLNPIPDQTRRWYPSRNSAGYLLFSIVTLGLFAIVWLYLALDDPLPHFQVQSHFEDEMRQLLGNQD